MPSAIKVRKKSQKKREVKAKFNHHRGFVSSNRLFPFPRADFQRSFHRVSRSFFAPWTPCTRTHVRVRLTGGSRDSPGSRPEACWHRAARRRSPRRSPRGLRCARPSQRPTRSTEPSRRSCSRPIWSDHPGSEKSLLQRKIWLCYVCF